MPALREAHSTPPRSSRRRAPGWPTTSFNSPLVLACLRYFNSLATEVGDSVALVARRLHGCSTSHPTSLRLISACHNVSNANTYALRQTPLLNSWQTSNCKQNGDWILTRASERRNMDKTCDIHCAILLDIHLTIAAGLGFHTLWQPSS